MGKLNFIIDYFENAEFNHISTNTNQVKQILQVELFYFNIVSNAVSWYLLPS